MKLTCHVVPAGDRAVYFDEAAALYAWSAYDVTVLADAFRRYASEPATLSLSYAGTVYATAQLRPVGGYRDRRVGTLSLVDSKFDTLHALIQAQEGDELPRHVKDFALSIAMTLDGAPVADESVQVVVLPFSESGRAQGVSAQQVDQALDGSSARPVQNAVVTQRFEGIDASVAALQSAMTALQTSMSTLQTTVTSHAGSAAVHVSTGDKEKWNAALNPTAAQKEAARQMLMAPLDASSSYDEQWARINAMTTMLANMMGVEAPT